MYILPTKTKDYRLLFLALVFGLTLTDLATSVDTLAALPEVVLTLLSSLTTAWGASGVAVMEAFNLLLIRRVPLAYFLHESAPRWMVVLINLAGAFVKMSPWLLAAQSLTVVATMLQDDLMGVVQLMTCPLLRESGSIIVVLAAVCYWVFQVHRYLGAGGPAQRNPDDDLTLIGLVVVGLSCSVLGLLADQGTQQVAMGAGLFVVIIMLKCSGCGTYCLQEVGRANPDLIVNPDVAEAPRPYTLQMNEPFNLRVMNLMSVGGGLTPNQLLLVSWGLTSLAFGQLFEGYGPLVGASTAFHAAAFLLLDGSNTRSDPGYGHLPTVYEQVTRLRDNTIYRVMKTNNLGLSSQSGVATMFRGTLHTSWHVTGGSPIHLGGEVLEMVEGDRWTDVAAYVGKNQMQPSDLDDIHTLMAVRPRDNIDPHSFIPGKATVMDPMSTTVVGTVDRDYPGGTSGSPIYQSGSLVGLYGNGFRAEGRRFISIFTPRLDGMAGDAEGIRRHLPNIKAAYHSSGKKIWVTDPPGSGKTTILVKELVEWIKTSGGTGRVLILTPTRVVAREYARVLGGDASYQVKGMSGGSGRINVMCHATLYKCLNQQAHYLNQFRLVVVDEAHFCNGESIAARAIVEHQRKVKGNLSAIYMTATPPDEDLLNIGSRFPITDENIEFQKRDKPDVDLIKRLCNTRGKTLIIVPTRQMADGWSSQLLGSGLVSVSLHRENFENNYGQAVDEATEVVVATNIVEMGANLGVTTTLDTRLAVKPVLVSDTSVDLQTRIISRSEYIQRRGRSGRHKPGWYGHPSAVPDSLIAGYRAVDDANAVDALILIRQLNPEATFMEEEVQDVELNINTLTHKNKAEFLRLTGDAVGLTPFLAYKILEHREIKGNDDWVYGGREGMLVTGGKFSGHNVKPRLSDSRVHQDVLRRYIGTLRTESAYLRLRGLLFEQLDLAYLFLRGADEIRVKKSGLAALTFLLSGGITILLVLCLFAVTVYLLFKFVWPSHTYGQTSRLIATLPFALAGGVIFGWWADSWMVGLGTLFMVALIAALTTDSNQRSPSQELLYLVIYLSIFITLVGGATIYCIEHGHMSKTLALLGRVVPKTPTPVLTSPITASSFDLNTLSWYSGKATTYWGWANLYNELVFTHAIEQHRLRRTCEAKQQTKDDKPPSFGLFAWSKLGGDGSMILVGLALAPGGLIDCLMAIGCLVLHWLVVSQSETHYVQAAVNLMRNFTVGKHVLDPSTGSSPYTHDEERVLNLERDTRRLCLTLGFYLYLLVQFVLLRNWVFLGLIILDLSVAASSPRAHAGRWVLILTSAGVDVVFSPGPLSWLGLGVSVVTTLAWQKGLTRGGGPFNDRGYEWKNRLNRLNLDEFNWYRCNGVPDMDKGPFPSKGGAKLWDLMKQARFEPEGHVVDLGCGRGSWSSLSASRPKVTQVSSFTLAAQQHEPFVHNTLWGYNLITAKQANVYSLDPFKVDTILCDIGESDSNLYVEVTRTLKVVSVLRRWLEHNPGARFCCKILCPLDWKVMVELRLLQTAYGGSLYRCSGSRNSTCEVYYVSGSQNNLEGAIAHLLSSLIRRFTISEYKPSTMTSPSLTTGTRRVEPEITLPDDTTQRRSFVFHKERLHDDETPYRHWKYLGSIPSAPRNPGGQARNGTITSVYHPWMSENYIQNFALTDVSPRMTYDMFKKKIDTSPGRPTARQIKFMRRAYAKVHDTINKTPRVLDREEVEAQIPNQAAVGAWHPQLDWPDAETAKGDPRFWSLVADEGAVMARGGSRFGVFNTMGKKEKKPKELGRPKASRMIAYLPLVVRALEQKYLGFLNVDHWCSPDSLPSGVSGVPLFYYGGMLNAKLEEYGQQTSAEDTAGWDTRVSREILELEEEFLLLGVTDKHHRTMIKAIYNLYKDPMVLLSRVSREGDVLDLLQTRGQRMSGSVVTYGMNTVTNTVVQLMRHWEARGSPKNYFSDHVDEDLRRMLVSGDDCVNFPSDPEAFSTALNNINTMGFLRKDIDMWAPDRVRVGLHNIDFCSHHYHDVVDLHGRHIQVPCKHQDELIARGSLRLGGPLGQRMEPLLAKGIAQYHLFHFCHRRDLRAGSFAINSCVPSDLIPITPFKYLQRDTPWLVASDILPIINKIWLMDNPHVNDKTPYYAWSEVPRLPKSTDISCGSRIGTSQRANWLKNIPHLVHKMRQLDPDASYEDDYKNIGVLKNDW